MSAEPSDSVRMLDMWQHKTGVSVTSIHEDVIRRSYKEHLSGLGAEYEIGRQLMEIHIQYIIYRFPFVLSFSLRCFFFLKRRTSENVLGI